MRTINQAATAAANQDDRDRVLSDACWKIAVRDGYWIGPGKHELDYQDVYVRAIKSMTQEELAFHEIIKD